VSHSLFQDELKINSVNVFRFWVT